MPKPITNPVKDPVSIPSRSADGFVIFGGFLVGQTEAKDTLFFCHQYTRVTSHISYPRLIKHSSVCMLY